MIAYVKSNPQRLWEVVHNRQYFEKVAGNAMFPARAGFWGLVGLWDRWVSRPRWRYGDLY